MQHPEQIIAEAIQTGFVKYPLEDDETVWNDEWIQPTESTHLAKAIILELAANGFEIVKRSN